MPESIINDIEALNRDMKSPFSAKLSGRDDTPVALRIVAYPKYVKMPQ
jgi:hypothetical protein